MSSTIKATTLIAVGQAMVAGVVPAKVAALMEGVMMSMMLTKLSKVVVTGLVVLCLCGLGVGGFHTLTAQETTLKNGSRQTAQEDSVKAVAAKPNMENLTAAEKDMASLQGTLIGVYDEANGQMTDFAEGEETRIVISGDKSVAMNGNWATFCTCTWKVVDAASSPKKLDLIVNGRTFRAIYQLNANTLRYCGVYSEREADRPKEFVTKKGDCRIVSMFKLPKAGVDFQRKVSAQEEANILTWEYKSITFGSDRKQNDKSFNEMQTAGWSYVGPDGRGMVAFKRPVRKESDAQVQNKIPAVKPLTTGWSIMLPFTYLGSEETDPAKLKIANANLPHSDVKKNKKRGLVTERFEQLVDALIKSKKSDEQVCEALFLATLARFPSEAELQSFTKYFAKEKNREEAINDACWALLNLGECLNHMKAIQGKLGK